MRKQLSAELGDPDFLNVVFDMDIVEKDQNTNQDGSNEAKKGKPGDKIKSKGKENNKSKGIDKTRAFKVSQQQHLRRLMKLMSNLTIFGFSRKQQS